MIGSRRIHRVEVLPLKIFDQRELHGFLIARVSNDGRNAREPSQLRRAKPSLAGDQLEESIALATDQHRLEQAILSDRLGQLQQITLGKLGARLVAVGNDVIQQNVLDLTARTRRFDLLWQER